MDGWMGVRLRVKKRRGVGGGVQLGVGMGWNGIWDELGGGGGRVI